MAKEKASKFDKLKKDKKGGLSTKQAGKLTGGKASPKKRRIKGCGGIMPQ